MKSLFSSLIIFIIFFYSEFTFSQKTYVLDDFLNYSKYSLDSKKNEKTKILNNKNNDLFKKGFLPSVSLNFTLPNYNRSISEISQPDGTFAFRESNTASSNARLSISQKIPYTGGQISISNSINRLDLFGDTNITSYSASWFSVNLNQPLNFFNAMNWDKKIQKAKLGLNEVNYQRDLIEIKGRTINFFFDMLKTKSEIRIIEGEVRILEKYEKIVLYLIESGKKIHYDSIDIKLALLKKQQDLRLIKKLEKLELQSVNTFLNIDKLKISRFDNLLSPTSKKKLEELDFYIDKYLSIHSILENNRLLGFQKRIKQLEKNRFYTANLSVGFGFNNSSNNFNDTFQSPNERQNFSIALNIPLLDFGKKRLEFDTLNIEYDVNKINLIQEKSQNIEKIKYLYEQIDDLYFNLGIEESRMKLLEIKIERMKKLLYTQKILLKDYSEAENQIFNSEKKTIDILHSIHENIIELEKITLCKII